MKGVSLPCSRLRRKAAALNGEKLGVRPFWYRSRATAFRDHVRRPPMNASSPSVKPQSSLGLHFFAFGKTAIPPLPARATAFRNRFFSFGKTAIPPLPALCSAYPTRARPGGNEWRIARRAKSLERTTAGRGSPSVLRGDFLRWWESAVQRRPGWCRSSGRWRGGCCTG